ncbi:N-(5'-phosphoribosyl)anthranilate isomerase [Pseudobythopirellula maris]|uniref:N-(5'-phosphoribosyl)anthranilate isomerase n=1 Tax=Pseudobythopirellula maris TaxID=2527991 RepID=A0A5C5ZMR1_9BACT|nr:phosphoribosylanthranilate isomerase [Pseudobythopirellula maris]TWT88448.1 N-(5'-phosphoribosyl)anthranilate isomerase [Pseudobythopirellula maris]
MFRIKICGLTRPADAAVCAEAGADAIGLNFYSGSPRCLTMERAVELADAGGEPLLRVGVFVNATLDELAAAVQAARLDAVQLHGDEPPAAFAALPEGIRTVRAWRVGAEGLPPLAEYLETSEAHGRRPEAALVDAAAPGAYGGTGKRVDWGRVAEERPLLGSTPLILAGGLTPDNVAEAIAAVRPDGVDTASGVESAPGVKDAGAVRAFVAAAREAFDSLSKSS